MSTLIAALKSTPSLGDVCRPNPHSAIGLIFQRRGALAEQLGFILVLGLFGTAVFSALSASL